MNVVNWLPPLLVCYPGTHQTAVHAWSLLWTRALWWKAGSRGWSSCGSSREQWGLGPRTSPPWTLGGLIWPKSHSHYTVANNFSTKFCDVYKCMIDDSWEWLQWVFVVDLGLFPFSELWREVWEYSGVSVQIYKGRGSGCGVRCWPWSQLLFK